MRNRTLASVFGLAVGLIAAPAIADDAEERKDKTEELAELLVELEDGASPEEQDALEKFIEENFEDDEREQMDGFLDDFEDDDFEDGDEPEISEFDDELDVEDDDDFEDGDEPEISELDDELDVEDDDDFFDQEPDEGDGDEDELAELDDESGEADDDPDLFDDDLDEEEFDEVAEIEEPDEIEEDEDDSEIDEPGFVVPAGGLTLKGFASGIGVFERSTGDRAVATRTTTGPDGVTVTITEDGSGGHKAAVVISGLSTVNPGNPAAPIGDISVNGDADGPRTFEGEGAAVAGDGTVTSSTVQAESNDTFDHLVWGSWSHLRKTADTADRQNERDSQLIVGFVTPDTADLSGLGTATYNGQMEGGFAPGGGSDIDSVRGDLSLTADFGTKTFDGNYALDSVDFGEVVANGTIESGSWTSPDGLSANLAGDSTMGAVSGDLQGAFFGPNAEEVGGNWELRIVGAPNSGEVGGVATGGFAAKR